MKFIRTSFCVYSAITYEKDSLSRHLCKSNEIAIYCVLMKSWSMAMSSSSTKLSRAIDDAGKSCEHTSFYEIRSAERI